ncbi:MAG: TerC family protein [Pyrinomonadaceae bacterium MAG19_C2-C3]|nr:TerC family protein [Pyrinomonadaceae bacterium MAG19_C2-C3]
MGYSIWVWVGFGIFILAMLSLDLGLLNRKTHAPTYREAGTWSAVWVSLAFVFAGIIYFAPTFLGIAPDVAGLKVKQFLTGYLIELSLSVDNLFVFLLVFSYFKVPKQYQHRVLFWGVLGALVMRITMIFLGTALIKNFHWIIYIFGAFLVYTGIKMMRGSDEETNPEDNPVVRFVTRFVPISRHYEEDKFFTIENGRRVGTLLFLVLVIVEVTDLVFAVDSIPAVFGVFRSPAEVDPFIVYTSNVFAILGLRSLYFLLAGVVDKFHLLKYGLAIVLTFIGVKMLLPGVEELLELTGRGATINPKFFHISIEVSLMVVLVVLVGSIVGSLVFPARVKMDDTPLPDAMKMDDTRK